MSGVRLHPVDELFRPKPGDLTNIFFEGDRRVTLRVLAPIEAVAELRGLPCGICTSSGRYKLTDVGAALWFRRIFFASAVTWCGFEDDAGPITPAPFDAPRVWDTLVSGNQLRLVLEALGADELVRGILAWLLPVPAPNEDAPTVPDSWAEPGGPAPHEDAP